MASRIEQVKAALQDKLELLVKDLKIEGSWRGDVFSGKSPVRKDRKAGSFVIWRKPNIKGGFKDYADDLVRGDILDLVGLCNGHGKDRKAALAWAEDWLGWKNLSKAEKAELQKNVVKREASRKQEDLALQRRKVDRARRSWSSFQPIAGTLGEVYFAHRGVPLDRIKYLLPFCRFSPETEYWFEAEHAWDADKNRQVKVKAGPKYPAIVSAMRDVKGDLQALHYTFLAKDGKGKAPVRDPSKAKLMFPRTTGTSIWLTRGAGNMNPNTMAKEGKCAPVIVGEGIEKTLAVSLAVPEIRALAAGSLANMLHVPMHPAFGSYIFIRDNDWDKPQAEEQFGRAVERIKRAGYPIEVVRAPEGVKDFDDLLRGA